MKYLGILKWYDSDKGFGVLSTLLPQKTSTAEVFFHNSCWVGNSIEVEPFSYDLKKRKNKGGYEASNCSLFDCSVDLWRVLFDNIDHNLYVNTKNGEKNLLKECVKMIHTPKDANNFIEVCKQWLDKKLFFKFSDISDILLGGRQVKVPEFQMYIKSIVESFSYVERKELFKNKEIGLYAFSDEECMRIIDLIDKNEYDTIIKSNSDLYLKIVRNKLLSTANNFSFEYESERNIYNYSKRKSEYDILEDLYADYILCANDEQKKDIIEEICTILVNKENELQIIINKLITNSLNTSDLANKLKKLLKFPAWLNTDTIQHLIKIVKKVIIDKYDFTNNIKLMSLGALPIDPKYIEDNFHCINNENIQYIIQENTGFTSEYVCNTLFSYLEKTNDIETTILWYNRRKDIQSVELTEKVKSYIETNIKKIKVAFVSKVSDYILLLGDDFVYNISKDFLQKTHMSEPLMKQFSCSSKDYIERISTLLFSFLHDCRDLVDENYVEPFCQYTYKDIHPLLAEDFIVDALEAFIDNTKNYQTALLYAKNYSSKAQKRIENYLFNLLSKEEYIYLWEEELCNYLPESYLEFYFDDYEYKYSLVEEWIKKERVTKENVVSAMINTLQRNRDKTYYRHFRTEFLIYVFFKNNQCESEITSNIDSSRCELFYWAVNPTYSNFEAICNVFILFPYSIQEKLLKFVFLIIAQGDLCIEAEDLRKLYNCIPIYKNHSETDKPVMSLSVSVVIESLCSYAKEKKFITDKDFYKLVYENAAYKTDKIIPIGGFFDVCSGKKKRYFPDPYYIKRFIYPILDKNQNRWYIINFEYDPHIVECVKGITGRRYHQNFKVWFVPESSLDEIIQFAEKNKFLLLKKDENSNLIGHPLSSFLQKYTQAEFKEAAWNLSILKEWNEDMPKITYCEGRESQKNNEPDVWWCVGHNPCNACAIKLHKLEEWQKFTLFDFCNILGFDISETNKYGHFNAGSYALFITSINRFNNLLNRLSCRDCGRIIYPIESNYSVVGATSFHCTNPQCKQYHNKIYLNHCFTRRCRGIIDSRDEAKCPNGLVICATCGTCCTTKMFEQRLLKLQQTGSRFIPQDLVYKAQNDEGHINHNDRKKADRFFCHKCGTELVGNPENTICSKCDTIIKYNISLISKQ